jgi:hypothetical protein
MAISIEGKILLLNGKVAPISWHKIGKNNKGDIELGVDVTNGVVRIDFYSGMDNEFSYTITSKIKFNLANQIENFYGATTV